MWPQTASPPARVLERVFSAGTKTKFREREKDLPSCREGCIADRTVGLLHQYSCFFLRPNGEEHEWNPQKYYWAHLESPINLRAIGEPNLLSEFISDRIDLDFLSDRSDPNSNFEFD